MKQTFEYNGEQFIFYEPSDIHDILKNVTRLTYSKRKIQYYNSANAFDIETTSYIKENLKFAFMYMWSFALEDYIIIGRTWEEFKNVCDEISLSLVTYKRRRFVIYVHNLAYEFQYIRKLFEWEKVFSLDKRVPILAVTTTGIEFRCSYKLSGYSLANLPTTLKKLTGALNYDLVRHSQTPLEFKELAYSIRDVQVVVEFIKNKIKEDGKITNIPMTKTGYVRIACRHSCFGEGRHGEQYKKYNEMIKKLSIFPEEYDMLKQAFQGGFTHANAYHVRRCEKGINGKHYLENVGSFDITSDYPAEMIAENGYPMSKGKYYKNPSPEIIQESIKNYFCIIDMTIKNLQDKVFIDNPISLSRCTEYPKKDVKVNNGRVVSSPFIRLTITQIDLEVIKACYDTGEIIVHRLIRYRRGYLPTEFIKQVLEFYKAKTILKGLGGEENERKYMWGKENLNATFGCSVTDALQPIIEYIGGDEDIFQEILCDKEKALKKYNNNPNRFLFYPWGVAITSFARRRLWGCILACGWDYCYSDTDSIKVMNPEKYLHIFKKSDEIITEKLKRAVKYHGLSWNDVAPKNQKGEPKQLGLWEWEHTYRKFRTCGAKRYMCEFDNALEVDGVKYDLTLTVSGLNKQRALPYLLNKYGNNDEVFKHFTQGLEVPPPYSGRMVSYYIDEENEMNITDYLGNKMHVKQGSGIALENTSYTMDYNETYNQYKAYINAIVGIYDPMHELERRLTIE